MYLANNLEDASEINPKFYKNKTIIFFSFSFLFFNLYVILLLPSKLNLRTFY